MPLDFIHDCRKMRKGFRSNEEVLFYLIKYVGGGKINQFHVRYRRSCTKVSIFFILPSELKINITKHGF